MQLLPLSNLVRQKNQNKHCWKQDSAEFFNCFKIWQSKVCKWLSTILSLLIFVLIALFISSANLAVVAQGVNTGKTEIETVKIEDGKLQAEAVLLKEPSGKKTFIGIINCKANFQRVSVTSNYNSNKCTNFVLLGVGYGEEYKGQDKLAMVNAVDADSTAALNNLRMVSGNYNNSLFESTFGRDYYLFANYNYKYYGSKKPTPEEAIRDRDEYSRKTDALTYLNKTKEGLDIDQAEKIRQKISVKSDPNDSFVTCGYIFDENKKPIFECTKQGKPTGPNGVDASISSCASNQTNGKIYFRVDENGNFQSCVSKLEADQASSLDINQRVETVNQSDVQSKNIFGELAQLVFDVVMYIILFLLYFAGSIAAFFLWALMNIVLLFLSINPAGATFIEVAKQPWQIVVGIANLITLFSFLAVGFGYLLDIKQLKVGIEQFLLNLIIFTVALNFTLLGTATFVNIGHGLGNVTIGVFTGGQGERKLIDNYIASIAQISIARCHGAGDDCKMEGGSPYEFIKKQFGSNSINLENTANITAELKNAGIGAVTAKAIMEATFVLVLMFSITKFWAVLWIVMSRTIGLWFLMVSSPLALAMKLTPLPSLQKFADEWIDKFWKLSLFYPAFVFGLVLTSVMARAFAMALNAQYNNLVQGGTITQGGVQVLAQESSGSQVFLFLALAVMGGIVGMAMLGAMVTFFEKSFNGLMQMALKGASEAWKGFGILSSVGGGAVRAGFSTAAKTVGLTGKLVGSTANLVTGGRAGKFTANLKQKWGDTVKQLQDDISKNKKTREQKLLRLQSLEKSKRELEEKIRERKKILKNPNLAPQVQANLQNLNIQDEQELSNLKTEIEQNRVEAQDSFWNVVGGNAALFGMKGVSLISPTNWENNIEGVGNVLGGVVEFTPLILQNIAGHIRGIGQNIATQTKARLEGASTYVDAKLSQVLRESGMADFLKKNGIYDIDADPKLKQYFTGQDQAEIRSNRINNPRYFEQIIKDAVQKARESVLQYSTKMSQSSIISSLEHMQEIYNQNKEAIEKGENNLKYKDPKTGKTIGIKLQDFRNKYLRLLEQAIDNDLAARVAFGTVAGRQLMRNTTLDLYNSLSNDTQEKIFKMYPTGLNSDELSQKAGEQISEADFRKLDSTQFTGPGSEAFVKGLMNNPRIDKEKLREKQVGRTYNDISVEHARNLVDQINGERIKESDINRYLDVIRSIFLGEGNIFSQRQIITQNLSKEFSIIDADPNLTTAQKEETKRIKTQEAYLNSFQREYGISVTDQTSPRSLVDQINRTNYDALKNSYVGKTIIRSIPDWDILSKEKQEAILKRAISELAVANFIDKKMQYEKLYNAANIFNQAIEAANKSVTVDNRLSKVIETALATGNLDPKEFITKNQDFKQALGAQRLNSKIKNKALNGQNLASEGLPNDLFDSLDSSTIEKMLSELTVGISQLIETNFTKRDSLKKALEKIEQERGIPANSLTGQLNSIVNNMKNIIGQYGDSRVNEILNSYDDYGKALRELLDNNKQIVNQVYNQSYEKKSNLSLSDLAKYAGRPNPNTSPLNTPLPTKQDLVRIRKLPKLIVAGANPNQPKYEYEVVLKDTNGNLTSVIYDSIAGLKAAGFDPNLIEHD